jgi:hypothetical protein
MEVERRGREGVRGRRVREGPAGRRLGVGGAIVGGDEGGVGDGGRG